MLIKEKLERAKASKEYSKVPQGSYLTHIFKIFEKSNSPWQIGFYEPEKDMITPVELYDNRIIIGEASEALKRHKGIERLDIDKVGIDFPKAMASVSMIQKNQYHDHDPIKVIMILQCIGKIIYNVTYVTKSFKILNIKLNADSGKLISHSLNTIFKFA